jgi:hypothetical protein
MPPTPAPWGPQLGTLTIIQNGRRLPWQVGLPDQTPESPEPFRDRLGELQCGSQVEPPSSNTLRSWLTEAGWRMLALRSRHRRQ